MYPYNLFPEDEIDNQLVSQSEPTYTGLSDAEPDEYEIKEIFYPGRSIRPPYNDRRHEPDQRHEPGRRHELDRRHEPDYGHNDKPVGPPPTFTPRDNAGVYAVDPGSIRGCVNNYVYIWLDNGGSFWMYPTYIGRKSISGYRWTHYGWVYTGYDLSMIRSFYCLPR